MKITVTDGRDLSNDQLAAWGRLQCADSRFRSPFFRPEFTQMVAATRDDVEVGIIEDDGQCVGFFPFQRNRAGVGTPVSSRLSDFHGVVLKSGVHLDPVELIRACGLSAWHFDHLAFARDSFSPFCWFHEFSPYIELPSGFDAYLDERRAAGAGEVMQTLNKKKKSERQLGPVRLEWRTTDKRVLESLMAWKAQQYQRSKIINPFTFPWVVELLERLLQMPDDPDFTGMLSALYIGDRLAAAHIGMRSRRTVHWWFTAYDPELGKYSPGSQLLLELTRESASRGLTRLDLGKGTETYKRAFMTGAAPLALGSIDTRPATRTVRRLWHRTRRWVGASRYRPLALGPWYMIMRVRDQFQFR
ncbi:MAG: GNAT family N-acetyltransferase [Planctomycetaceae bacterium]